jgi:hypothetical protein
MQQAHVHEVGHLLGLDHVDVGKPHCLPSGDTNASACYGVDDKDMVSVMGSGMQLRIENAYPWREALRHFVLEDIVASTVRKPVSVLVGARLMSTPLLLLSLAAVWPAKMQRHYPRIDAEMKANRSITMRPMRPR